MAVSPNIGQNYAERVAEIYRDAELRVLERIAAAVAAGIDAPDWDERLLARLQRVRTELVGVLARSNADAARRITAVLEEAYEAGELSMFADIGRLLDPLKAEAAARVAAVAAIADELTGKAVQASSAVLRLTDDVYRQVTSTAIAQAAAGAEFRKVAAQQALNALVGQGLRVVETARGAMDLADYVTMAVRTGVARAAITGHTMTMQANGLDLVVVQPGPRPCEVCDTWARAVLSLDESGAAGTVERPSVTTGEPLEVEVAGTLEDARADGWGHPNCRCNLQAFLPGATDPDVLERPEWDAEGYAAQQEQRALEREIRAAKEAQAVALDEAAAREAAAEVREAQAALREHLARHEELKRQPGREQIGTTR